LYLLSRTLLLLHKLIQQPSTSATDSIDFTPDKVFSKVMKLQSEKSPGPDTLAYWNN